MKKILLCAVAALSSGASIATVVNTSNAATVAAFQAGIMVNNFESVTGRTPQSISSYTAGNAIGANAFVFDQLAGVQFSVGGQVGVNRPALFALSGAIAGDAKSGDKVLGPVDFEATTNFDTSFIEIYFPVKVAQVGFWVNPALGNVSFIAADTNFAFSGLNETLLEQGVGTNGNFVGISRATADIGGFKIFGSAGKAFTIDDFSYGTASPVPEAGHWALMLMGLGALSWRLRQR